MSRHCLQLEHRVLKTLKTLELPKRWLLAVSGGLDSIVLAEILWRWQRYLKIEITLGHVHHGTDENLSFRNEAQAFVRSWAAERQIPFLTLRPRPRSLLSEAELRRFRHRTLARWRKKYAFDRIVLAHHRDDLLETRLLRLIRGSGPQGLTAMSLQSGTLLRPLLSLTRAELELYAEERGLKWVEDPSNAETSAFRNWLRHTWLPELEFRQKGALKSLTRSLETLAPKATDVRLGNFVGLRRRDLGRVAFARQQTVVAEYLRALGIQGYGRAHVDEILKRLNTCRGEFEFEMLGLRFRVTPDLLWASRV